MNRITDPTIRSTVPAAVRLSVAGWLTTIAAGAAEALAWTGMPNPPTSGQLAVRFAIYAVLVVLVLALLSGRNVVRWAVAALLGGIGTLSLIIEPVSWLTTGGSPATFLLTADGPTLLIAGLRVVHLVAVLAALVLMFTPRASAFFHPVPQPA